MPMPAKKNFPLRIDPGLYAVLERWAADELRSINAHIEFLLRESARRAGRLQGGMPGSSGEEKKIRNKYTCCLTGRQKQQVFLLSAA